MYYFQFSFSREASLENDDPEMQKVKFCVVLANNEEDAKVKAIKQMGYEWKGALVTLTDAWLPEIDSFDKVEFYPHDV